MAVTGVAPATFTDPAHASLFKFMQTISETITRWSPAIWVGYNSIGFDEKFLRQVFHQSLHPEIFITQNAGNNRMDVMKLVYAAWELACDAFEWPLNDRGRQAFKLENMAPAKGFDEHDAHDALGDVKATIYLANLVRERPRVSGSRLFGT